VQEDLLDLRGRQPVAQRGLTPAEIKEVLLHVAVYAGVPAANAAFAVAAPIVAAWETS